MKRRTTPRRLIPEPVWPVIMYGGVLAGGVLLLQWLEYQQYARTHAAEVRYGLLAALFLGIGIWVGMHLFGGKPHVNRTPGDGNPAAREALGISEREFEVLQLLAAGHANKEIAARLYISPNTVKTHVARLLEKLDARRRTEAISKARGLGIVS